LFSGRREHSHELCNVAMWVGPTRGCQVPPLRVGLAETPNPGHGFRAAPHICIFWADPDSTSFGKISMDTILTTVTTAALSQGMKFLYEQATEVLRGWRARRHGTGESPKILTVPTAVNVGAPDPLVEPRDRSMEDTLLDLRDSAERVTTGAIDPASPEARRIAGNLRDYLEVVLRAPISFAGEEMRTFEAGRIDVVVSRVEGEVAGVRARSGTAARLGDVSVRAGDVADGGRVSGVELG
jgi:hypothetical protein